MGGSTRGGTDARVMVVGEVSVDTGREGTDARVMGGEEVVVGMEDSADRLMGVGGVRGRIELVGGGVCPAAIRVGVGGVMGWVGSSTVEDLMGVARTEDCAGGGSADAKATLAVIQITDRRSPESTRRFQFVMDGSLRYPLTQEVESSTNVSSAANLASMNVSTSWRSKETLILPSVVGKTSIPIDSSSTEARY